MLPDKDYAKRLTEKKLAAIRAMVEEARQLTNDVAEPQKLRQEQEAREQTAQNINQFFNGLKVSPCSTCITSCCRMGEAYGTAQGYLQPDQLHPDIVSGEVDLLSFALPYKNKDLTPGKDWQKRCLFLSARGCNLPAKYRSTICLTYVCETLAHYAGMHHPDSLPNGKELVQIGRRIANLLNAESRF